MPDHCLPLPLLQPPLPLCAAELRLLLLPLPLLLLLMLLLLLLLSVHRWRSGGVTVCPSWGTYRNTSLGTKRIMLCCAMLRCA